jgi:hypothetical protein
MVKSLVRLNHFEKFQSPNAFQIDTKCKIKFQKEKYGIGNVEGEKIARRRILDKIHPNAQMI